MPSNEIIDVDLRVFEPGDLLLWNQFEISVIGSNLIRKEVPQFALILKLRRERTVDVWWSRYHRPTIITSSDLGRWLLEPGVNPRVIRNEEVIWPTK